MNTDEIFGRDNRFLPLRRKVEKIAAAKKITFGEAVILCLKGASTQIEKHVKSRVQHGFSRPKGGSTCAEKGGVK